MHNIQNFVTEPYIVGYRTHNFVVELNIVRHTTHPSLLMTVHIKYRSIVEHLPYD